MLGFSKVTRDFTERRAAQERAIADARRIARAEAESRTKTEFLTTMSHELRTPINALLGYTDLLEMELAGPVTPQQLAYLERIRASQRHLLGIVTDLLNYSGIAAGELQYDLRSAPVREVLENVLPMVRMQAEAKGVELEHEPGGDGLIARADRAKAEQIALNLVANAVKFTPAGGTRVGDVRGGGG